MDLKEKYKEKIAFWKRMQMLATANNSTKDIAFAENKIKEFEERLAGVKRRERKGVAAGFKRVLGAGLLMFGLSHVGSQLKAPPVVKQAKAKVTHSVKETLQMFQDLMPEEKTPEQLAQDEKRRKENQAFLKEIGYQIEYTDDWEKIGEDRRALREAGLYGGTDGIEYGNLKEAAKHYSGTDVFKTKSGRGGR